MLHWNKWDGDTSHAPNARRPDTRCDHYDLRLNAPLRRVYRLYVAGQLDGMQAFMGGKLKLAGDMMFATTLQTWFNT